MTALRTAAARHRGFSLIETIMAVAMLGILLAIATPTLGSLVTRNDVRISADTAVDALREAQSAAMARKDSGQYGVHFETGQFVFFEGTSYSVGDPDNVVHELDPQVEITGITLTGGGSEAFFVNHKGTTAQDGTIVFTSETGTRTITVNAAGLIDVD